MFSREEKRFSLSGRVYRLFAVAYILFFCILIYLSVYIYREISKHTRDNYATAARYFASQMDDSLTSVFSFLFSAVYSNSDVDTLRFPGNSSELALAGTRVMKYLTNSSPSFLEQGGAFIYVPSTDFFTSTSGISGEQANSFFRTELRTARANNNLTEYTEYYKKNWQFIDRNGEWYAVRMLNYNGIISGAWFSLESLLENFSDVMISKEILLFASGSDMSVVYSTKSLPNLQYEPSDASYILEENGDSVKYIAITTETRSFRERFAVLVSTTSMNSALTPFYIASLATCIVFLLSAIVIASSIRKNLARPSRELRKITASLQSRVLAGNAPVDIPEFSSNCREIQDIYEALGPLLSEMSSLRDRYYEAQIAKNEFELQSLKNQVAPHFLINCLSALSSLSNSPANQPLMKTLIARLANHLRYTLSTNSSVSISSEIRHLEGYFEMMQIRYPNSLVYHIDVQDLSEDATVFPCIIIMFSENSIKHNLAVGEELTIDVVVREEMHDGENFIHITHIDSGQGFDEEILTELQDLETFEPTAQYEGHRIGLYNIVKRLKLAYGNSKSSIAFSNEPGSGARIDIVIPFIPYQES